MAFLKKFAAVPVLVAVSCMATVPAAAADLPVPAPRAAAASVAAWAPGDDTAHQYRRYRHRRDRGIDAGDILAGAAIIGGIAILANAATKSDDRYPRRDARYPYRGPDFDRGGTTNGLDRAASMCVAEVEREARVASVDTVNRDARGWRVSGALYDGQSFTCSIGDDGRIDDVDFGYAANPYGGAADEYAPQVDRQYDADYYAAARARMDTSQPGYTDYPDVAQPDYQSGAQPAYPGGPLPGEEGGYAEDGNWSDDAGYYPDEDQSRP